MQLHSVEVCKLTIEGPKQQCTHNSKGLLIYTYQSTFHPMKAKQTYDIHLLSYPPIGNLPTPIIHVLRTTAVGFTSPDSSRIERYIVEFECRVRNITFVEKYMSVSASGGTGQVVTSGPCFGGLGHLYRVKVWAVSGPNISRLPAVKLVNTGTVSTVCSCLLFAGFDDTYIDCCVMIDIHVRTLVQ